MQTITTLTGGQWTNLVTARRTAWRGERGTHVRWEPGINRAVTAALALVLAVALIGIGLGIAPAVAEEDDREAVDEFNAIGTDGFVEINSEEIDSPIHFPEPDEVDQPIAIAGTIYDDGTWEASKEDVSFPNIDDDVDEDIPTEIILEADGPFGGDIDRETGAMTVEGTLNIIVPSADAEIQVTSVLTTGESGQMSGSTEGLDTDSGTVTLVDNEFVIPEATGNFAIDGFIGLPSDEPGMNWFELTLDMDFSDDDDPVDDVGTVSGVVTDENGEPIEGATVSAAGESTTTGSNGAYDFEVPVGAHDLTVSAFGYSDGSETVDVLADETTTVPDIELTELATGTISGVVTDSDGEPIEGATVSVQSVEITTDSNGAYELELPAGSHDVTIDAPEFQTSTQTVDVAGDATVEIDAIALESDIDPPNFRAASIDGADVEPGETVHIEGTITNTGGPGEQQVTISIADESSTETVSLEANDQATVTLEWETTDADEGDHQARLETEDDSISTTILVGDVDIDVEDADFVARSTGGYITFGIGGYDEIADQFGMESIETHDDIREAINLAHEEGNGIDGPGLSLPDKNVDDEHIVLAGDVNWEEGTWELIEGFFPALEDPAYPFDGFVELPEGTIEGEIDREAGILTAETTFQVFVDGRDDATFTFDLIMTSEESGEIPTGTAEIDQDSDEGYVHLVSNDYIVDDQTNDGIIDSEMNLPSTDPSENYFELGFEVNFDPEDVEINGDPDRTGPQFQENSIILNAGLGIGAAGFVVALVFIGSILFVRVNGN